MIGRSEYGVPAALDFVDRLRDEIVPAAGFPDDVDVFAGGGPPGGRDFLDLTYGAFPWLVLAVLAADLRPAPARVPVAAAPAEGDHPQPALDRRRLRPARHLLQVGRGRLVRAHLLRPDRGLDPGLRLRHGVRPLDGLRGLPRQPHARGVGRRPRQRARGLARARQDRPHRHRGGPDHVRRVHGLRRRLDRRAAAVRLRPRDRRSSSTSRSSGPCSCPARWRCSGAGTGGCRTASRRSSACRRRRSSRRRPARRRRRRPAASSRRRARS